MNKEYECLIEKTKIFESLLKKYAVSDRDVEQLLEWNNELFVTIYAGNIKLPYYDYKLGIYLYNPDISPIADRYWMSDLMNACADFGCALKCIDAS